MDTVIDGEKIIVGVRQSLKALKNGKAAIAYMADDTDESIKRDFIKECAARNVEIVRYRTMIELGRDCGIEIGASVACRILSEQ